MKSNLGGILITWIQLDASSEAPHSRDSTGLLLFLYMLSYRLSIYLCPFLLPPSASSPSPPLSLILPLPGEQHGLQACVWSEFQHQCLSTNQTPGMLLPRILVFPPFDSHPADFSLSPPFFASKLAVQSHHWVKNYVRLITSLICARCSCQVKAGFDSCERLIL